MRQLLAFLCPIVALAACAPPPPPPKPAPAPEDPWKKLPPSQDWLDVTSDFKGDRAAECEHVRGWLKGEDACHGAICGRARGLATEWLARCPKLAGKDATGEVKALSEQLATRAAEAPSACARKLEPILGEGCGEDKTCEAAAQAWTTRCGKDEGTRLTILLIRKAVARRQPAGSPPPSFDPRSCDELLEGVHEAAKCGNRAACADVAGEVEAYRARCEDDEARPTIATAVQEQTVLATAGRPTPPILVKQGSPTLGAGDAPVPLADGAGAVIALCGERVLDLDRYLDAQKRCKGGKLVAARAFKGQRGVEVHVGSLDFPDDATFSTRYPTILAAGELERSDKQELAVFKGELDRVGALAKTPKTAPEAARALAKAVIAHAPAIRRSAAFRTALTSYDEALAPALKELGKAKLGAALSGKGAPEEVLGLVLRAKTRAFADVNGEGAVEIGAGTRADRLDTTALLPRSMAAYGDAMKAARPRPMSPKVIETAKASGIAAATACGGAEKKLQESKLALVSCNFGLDTCDAVKTATLAKALDAALVNAEGFYHELDLVRTGAASEAAAELGRAAEAAGCREPWW